MLKLYITHCIGCLAFFLFVILGIYTIVGSFTFDGVHISEMLGYAVRALPFAAVVTLLYHKASS